MTEHQRLINRAKKVAALLTSPVAGEAVAASEMLEKILVQHKLSLSEIGLQNININREAKAATETKTSASNDIVRNSSEIVGADSDEIIEVICKSAVHDMSSWLEDLILKIAKINWVNVIVQHDCVKLIGYPGNLKIVKTMIVSLRTFIQSQLSTYGYNDEQFTTGYAAGVIDRVVRNMMCSSPRNMTCYKAHQLSKYMIKHYGIDRKVTFKNVCHDSHVYQAGLSDGDGYRKVA